MTFFKTAREEENSAKAKRGFTLIEILVVIGIIAVLAAVVLIAINPARQFAQARDSQRTSNVNAILNAVGQNLADNAGLFNRDADGNPDTLECDEIPEDPASAVVIASTEGVDLAPCLMDYIPALPFDPGADDAEWEDETSYNTEYTIQILDNGRVEVCAPTEETVLERTDPICVTR